MLKVILGGLKQSAWVENTSVAISMSWMSSFKPQCLWVWVTMLPCWHFQHVGTHFRFGMWPASTSEACWSPVLLNNTRLHGFVYMPLRLHVCAQSHSEHLWHSGRVEPATTLWGSVTDSNTSTNTEQKLKKKKKHHYNYCLHSDKGLC